MQSIPDPVTLTEAAALHFKKILIDSNQALGIRLGLRDAGCSGKAYTIDFATEKKNEDVELLIHGIRFFLNGQDVPYLRGTDIDYVQEGFNARIQFKNPNVENACGCGESVHFKEVSPE